MHVVGKYFLSLRSFDVMADFTQCLGIRTRLFLSDHLKTKLFKRYQADITSTLNQQNHKVYTFLAIFGVFHNYLERLRCFLSQAIMHPK